MDAVDLEQLARDLADLEARLTRISDALAAAIESEKAHA